MRGQIKMFETIGVLVVFFFLLTAGFAFYFQVQKSSISKNIEESYQQRAFNTALKAMYLPELDCSFLVTQRENCIDKIKAERFSSLARDNSSAATFYFEEFGDSTLSVKQVYPAGATIVLYSSKPEIDPITGDPSSAESINTQTPILLYDAVRDDYLFAILEVTKYV